VLGSFERLRHKAPGHTVGRDVPNSYFQSRDEKTRLSVPGYKNSGTKDRQNRSFPYQGQCTQKHVKYLNLGTKRHVFTDFEKIST